MSRALTRIGPLDSRREYSPAEKHAASGLATVTLVRLSLARCVVPRSARVFDERWNTRRVKFTAKFEVNGGLSSGNT